MGEDGKVEIPRLVELREGGRSRASSALRAVARPVLEEGEVLAGRYRILCFLDRGGIAEVYEASDASSGEGVALKLLRPDLASDQVLLARFRREVRYLESLSHKNVCSVLGFEQTRRRNGGQAVFMVLELLDGVGLDEIVAHMGRLAPGDALPIVKQIAAGLGALHEVGIIHRDLKSGNVLLVKSMDPGDEADGGGLRVVLTDLGFARGGVESPEGSESSLTMEGQLLGTIAYMAPEQLRGEKATSRTDIYALGLILYEIVTGRLPFSSTGSFVEAVRRLQDPAPSPRVHSPNLPAYWETTILRCLEIDPDKRFGSAADVVSALSSLS